MVGPAAPLPPGPQLSCSQSCYPVPLKLGFISKIPNVNIVKTTQEDLKDLIPMSSPLSPQLGAKGSLYIDIAIAVTGVDLYH